MDGPTMTTIAGMKHPGKWWSSLAAALPILQFRKGSGGVRIKDLTTSKTTLVYNVISKARPFSDGQSSVPENVAKSCVVWNWMQSWTRTVSHYSPSGSPGRIDTSSIMIVLRSWLSDRCSEHQQILLLVVRSMFGLVHERDRLRSFVRSDRYTIVIYLISAAIFCPKLSVFQWREQDRQRVPSSLFSPL